MDVPQRQRRRPPVQTHGTSSYPSSINSQTTYSSSTGAFVQQNRPVQPIRLKCIVLGAANAGKTSILRRYFHGTFEYGRNTTVGSDFYTRRIPNPIHRDVISSSSSSRTTGDSNSSSTGIGFVDENDGSNPNTPKDQKGHGEKRIKKHQKTGRSVEAGTDSNSGSTAKKNTTTATWVPSISRQPYVSIQMWDTAGRERFISSSTRRRHNSGFSSTLGDAFFAHAHAAMLVYDATSSTSFTQLLRWHAELMERMDGLASLSPTDRDCMDDGIDGGTKLEGAQWHSGNNTNIIKKKRKRFRHGKFPVLIVANKLDKFECNIAEPSARRTAVPQRDVLGLGGTFKGKDSRYEYSASPTTATSAKSPTSSSSSSGGSDSKKKTKQPLHQHERMTSSTFYSTGEKWTSDFSYLDSVLTAEDRSHPDRDMVLLWCMRNGLKHVEVSALDGTGINTAIESLVVLALESINEEEKEALEQAQSPHVEKKTVTFVNPNVAQTSQLYHDYHNRRPNKIIDFHERYATKDDRRCCFQIIPWCR